MQNIIDANYQVVQDRTPEVIRTEIKTIEANVYKTTLDGVIQIGLRLGELKEMVGHGNWIQWCKGNLGYSDRQARRYIEISQEYGNENSPFSNWTISSNLSISKAYSLLTLPENEVESFSEEHDVENMTVKQLEAEIKEWKSKTEALQEDKKTAAEVYGALKRQMEEKQTELDQAKEENADSEEIKNLHQQLDKEKRKAEKAKEDLKKEQESKNQAVQSALAEKEEELLKVAEAAHAEKVKTAEDAKRDLENQLAETKKKLKLSGNEDIVKVKLNLDGIQKSFMNVDVALENIGLTDKEQENKLREATKMVLQKLIDRLATD